MTSLPARVIQAVRPQASSGVMAGAAVVAATFASTPFLLPNVAERLSVGIGATGLISVAEMGSFTMASFLAGRLFRPRRRFHYGSLAIIAVAMAASALVTSFPLLLACRAVSGLGMGALTWIAWADATRFPRGMGDVAAVAPVTATIASPILGGLMELGGYPLVFGVLTTFALLACLLPVDFGDLPRIGRNVSSSRSNRVLLATLLTLLVGGSSVFIFTAAAGEELHGLTPVTISLGFSLNAIAGVVATRRTAGKRTAAPWLAATALSTLAVGVVSSAPLFFLALTLWGFAFWMAVPAVLRMLAARSLHPSERMGDAQAAMAAGRVLGPLVGGLALGAGQFGRLSVVGSAVIMVSAFTVGVVEWYRARLPVPGTEA